MNFRELDIKLIYDTSTADVINELIVPILKSSKSYFRGVGYFSSAWLGLVSNGIQNLVANNGKIHLLTSPQLNEDDWNAIINGERAKSDMAIYQSICHSIEKFDLKAKQDILNALSWLIADGYLDLKFVVCKNIVGNYHDKVAIFEDETGDRICLHGSLNDSIQATYNGESVSVFKSWIAGQSEYLDEHYRNYYELYNGKNEYFLVLDIPEILLTEFKKYQLPTRPYKIKTKVKDKNELHLPSYVQELNDYQIDAIDNFINNSWQGIFEMATGTGKTVTAIEATRKYFELHKRIFIFVTVPFKHLVVQWEKVLRDFGYTNIICCYKGLNNWYAPAKRYIKNFNADLQESICFITTYKTASSQEFISLIKSANKDIFFIADECHYIGSNKFREIMLDNILVRLGLSATPERWFDDDGTALLRKYFNKTVYEYELKTAIKNGYLTKYNYHPIIVHLTEDELDIYSELSMKISKYSSFNNEFKLESNSYLASLFRARSNVISQAINKKVELKKILSEELLTNQINHTLVYCAKGESKEIVRLVADLNIKVHDFVYDVTDNHRVQILTQFDNGDLEVLVAIKCLDEGVDIPSTQSAYFLASTSNPREFVQRRGRILRTSKGKKEADLYDFIVMPRLNDYLDDEQISILNRSIAIREIPRFSEFAHSSENQYMANDILLPYLKALDLEYLIHLLPNEIYHELYPRENTILEESDLSEEY